MIKEIKYNGFTATPSDYESPDGDLAVVSSLLNEDGAIHPIFPPTLHFSLPKAYNVVLIHKSNNYTHYIIRHTDSLNYHDYLYWINEPEQGAVVTTDAFTSSNRIGDFNAYRPIHEVNVVGNTLLVLTDNGIHYALWSGSTYKYLGNHLPEISLSIGLEGRPRFYSLVYDGTFTINFDAISRSDIEHGFAFSDNNKRLITEQVMAKLNKFVADTTTNKGRHCFPFFVRYALRLYDGSLALHSAPILMNPGTTSGPIVMWNRITGNSSYTSAKMNIMLMASSILWRVVNDGGTADAQEWKDIVKSVDIFISKPIYTYDPNGYCTSFLDDDNFNSRFIGKLYWNRGRWDAPMEDCIIQPINGGADMLNWYSEYPYWQIYEMFYNPERSIPNTTLHLPEYNEEKRREHLENISNFYLLHSIPVEELSTYEHVITTPDDYLQSLESREVMTDDYQTHDTLSPQIAYMYNNRLNIGNIKRKLYGGYKPVSMFARCCDVHNFSVSQDGDYLAVTVAEILSAKDSIDIYTYIKIDGIEYVVKNATDSTQLVEFFSHTYNTNTNSTTVTPSSLAWLFYPDANAYKMVIKQGYPNPYYEIALKPHPFLNGAYAFINYNAERDRQSLFKPTCNNPGITLPNKVYSSVVDNPFVFPPTGIITPGTGTIFGLRSATKALSQGQFGQFPLYAFSTEGVWALEINSEGKISARQPITRDVCIHTSSITQIDTAVLFATARGIMLLSGSTATCISDELNNSNTIGLPQEIDNNMSIAPFLSYITECQMLYDYTHQRIILFNPAYSYSYIYSLKSKKWGLTKATYNSSLNAYPDALAAKSGTRTVQDVTEECNDIVNLSVEVTSSSQQGVILTRPLKLDSPDTLKTIDTVIQRGYFRREHVKTILYGSRDLLHWFVVGSSTTHELRGLHGTPYKYFRIAVLCDLQADESIYGATIQLKERYTKKLR